MWAKAGGPPRSGRPATRSQRASGQVESPRLSVRGACSAGGNGTHSRAARSFLDYGKKLDGPRVGAIAIFYRKGANNGHVGVVRGTDGQGNPIVVSGNHGNAVRQSTYPKSKVLAYVMPPQYVLDDMIKAAKAAALAKEEAPLR